MFLFSKDEDSPRIKQLRALSLFSTLSPRELKTVDGLLHERSFLKDEVIFDQGEEGQALYIIESGKVLICRQGQSADGRIAELGPGRDGHVIHALPGTDDPLSATLEGALVVRRPFVARHGAGGEGNR